MPLHLKNQELHKAIFHLQLALARAGGRAGVPGASKAKLRIVFLNQADCAAIKSALMEEMLAEPREANACNPPRFRVCGVDVALLTEDR